MDLFHRNWIEDKKLIPPSHYAEVNYQDLLQCPGKVIQDIYKQLQLPEFTYCEPAMSKFLASQKSYKTIQHVIPEETREKIKNRFISDPSEIKLP
jgi:hypothetical protein